MKKLFTLLMLASLTLGTTAQELDSLKSIMNKKDAPEASEHEQERITGPVIVEDDGEEVNIRVMEKEVVKVIENGDTTFVKIGEKGVLQVTDQPDSTTIRVGNKEIKIVERDDDTNIRIHDIDRDDSTFDNPRFRGHWAGFEWGLNDLLNNNFSLSRTSEDRFMDLNTGRSWVININFAQYSLGFGTSHAGLVTGLGLEMNNYFFDNNNTILEVDDYVIDSALTGNVAKSKLTSTYLRVPLILEFQFPKTIRARRVFISAGIVASLKLGSHTKVVYKENGKNKDKNRDDFNLSPFRYGLTARAGFGNVSVFGDYYLSTLLVKDKGPELHPFSVGLAFNF